MKQLWIPVILISLAATFTVQAQFAQAKAGKLYWQAGRDWLQKGELEKALLEFDRAIAAAPKLTAAWYSRGVVKFLLSQPDAARADFDQALRLNPKFTDAYVSRGMLCAELGEAERALRDLTHALTLKPRDARIFHYRAAIRLHRQDFDGAIRDNTQAVKLDPKLSHAWCDRGKAR